MANVNETDLSPLICEGCEEEMDDEAIAASEGESCNYCAECRVEESLEQAEGDPDGSYNDGDDWQIDGVGFADPGGESALRATTPDNPRDRPCPTCEAEDVLTGFDVAAGYQCNVCAERAECGMAY